jgi:putative zinc finger/helix-turn-helix YgiT family protein
MKCPNGHGEMNLATSHKKIRFRETDINVPVRSHVCPVCGLEAGSVQEGAMAQRAIADTYRKTAGLLTGEEIVRFRKKMRLTQPQLAGKMGVGVASIKRWELGLIQTKSMDRALRTVFWNDTPADVYTGNRRFSIPRVKIVLNRCEGLLGKKLLESTDKMLFSAKYLWYADMAAYRDLRQSMTGATYAALPLGPQLNNYRDLLNDIRDADTAHEEPLTAAENALLERITRAFPRKWDVYNAAHKEAIWKRRAVGEIIPYSDARELSGI